jgi:hypothetical protein
MRQWDGSDIMWTHESYDPDHFAHSHSFEGVIPCRQESSARGTRDAPYSVGRQGLLYGSVGRQTLVDTSTPMVKREEN